MCVSEQKSGWRGKNHLLTHWDITLASWQTYQDNCVDYRARSIPWGNLRLGNESFLSAHLFLGEGVIQTWCSHDLSLLPLNSIAEGHSWRSMTAWEGSLFLAWSFPVVTSLALFFPLCCFSAGEMLHFLLALSSDLVVSWGGRTPSSLLDLWMLC